MTNQWFLSLLEVSLTTSIVILTIKMLSFLINAHYAAKWKKLIWLIIAIRLLIPINFSIANAPIQVNIPDGNVLEDATQSTIDDKKADEVKEAVTLISDEATNSTVLPNQLTRDMKNRFTWMDAILIVWGSGCMIFLFYHIIGYLYFRKQILRWSRVSRLESANKIISELSTGMKLKKHLKVYECDRIASPSLMGFVFPILVIPSEHYSKEELTFIIKHELTHYKHGDLWYKLILLLANSVHWFNPVVYLLRKESDIDMEFSCDDAVIKGMSQDNKKTYGETILSCINKQKMRKVSLTTCFTDTTKNLKDRFNNIFNKGKKRSGRIIIFIILLFIVSISAMVVFTNESNKQTVSDELKWYGAKSLIFGQTKLPEELIGTSDEWTAFLESDKTIALVADIPSEDIYVYGLKENGEEEGTYTLHGIYIRQGSEIQVLDIDWGIYAEVPIIQYEDYDQDGTKELAMILRSASGTGIAFNDLHILEKNEEGGWTDHLFTAADWSDIINDRLTYQEQDGILTMAIDGEDTGLQIDIASLEKEWGNKLDAVSFGNVGEFSFKDGKILLQVQPIATVGNWVTPQSITDTYINMEVLYNNGFDLKNAFGSD